MTRKQDSAKARMTAEDLKQLLSEDGDLLKTIIEQTVQQVLAATGLTEEELSRLFDLTRPLPEPAPASSRQGDSTAHAAGS